MPARRRRRSNRASPAGVVVVARGGIGRRAPRRPLANQVDGTGAVCASPIEEGRRAPQALVREGLHRRALIAADALVAAFVVAAAVTLSSDALGFAILIATPTMVVVNKAAGLYERDELVLQKSTLDEAPALAQVSALFALLVSQLLSRSAGVSSVLLLAVATFAFLFTGRVAARWIARRLATVERCMVIGDEASIATVSSKLASSPAKAAVVTAMQLHPGGGRDDVAAFREEIDRHQIDRVIIAPLESDPAELLEIVRVAKAIGLRVSLIPRLLEVVGSAVAFDQLDGLTVLAVRSAGLGRSSRALKRTFDIVGSTAAIVLLAPLMLAIAVAVRCDSRGPVFFRQVRVGRHGRRFEIIKFRSMVCDAEAMKASLAHLNETQGLFKIRRDPRVTAVGRLLRRSCLDELPQLFNVWRGDMSLVGPRPLVTDEDAKITGLDRSRLRLTPGMTGPWQVLGSARIPLQEMVAIDYLYVANWSLWTDVKLLVRTIPLVLSRAGL
jgi:exopolysaccharide biosynthesis polyprenyl glycosylphosphotransferase